MNEIYSQKTLVGKWRRVDENKKNQKLNNKQLVYGDMELRSDSTFHIEGDAKTKNSNVQGWHSGDEYNGTWQQLNNKSFVLWMKPKADGLFILYQIIQHDKTNLIVRIGLERKKAYHIKFIRLQ